MLNFNTNFNCASFNEVKTFHIETLGCKVNQYESMAVKSSLLEAGYLEANENEIPDIYIINTCSVTHIADKKSRQCIRRGVSTNPNALIIVMGCYAQMKAEEIKKINGVGIVIGTKGKADLVNVINNYYKQSGIPKAPSPLSALEIKTYEEIKSEYHPDKTRAFIKVQDGCNIYCSYCIIPYARGKIRSRKVLDVLEEIEFLSKSEYKEIVLTGIHLSSYGLDFDKGDCDFGDRLIDLVEKIAEAYPKIRIRLGSLEPGIVTNDFAKRLSNINSFCEQFHLSLQSGSDEILRLMKRRYDTKRYLAAVNTLRKYFKKPAITTDIIVGFPSESDALFLETYNFCEKINFADIHVFPYSPRQGTPAAKMKNQIKKSVKVDRVAKMIELGDKMEYNYLKSLIGSEQEIIVEECDGHLIKGRARNYAQVFLDSDKNYEVMVKKNSLIKCKVLSCDKKSIKGGYCGLSIL